MQNSVAQDREGLKVIDDFSRVAEDHVCKIAKSDKVNSRITKRKQIVRETSLGVREANIQVRDEKSDDKVLDVNKDRRSTPAENQKPTKDDQLKELEDEEDGCCKCFILKSYSWFTLY